MEKNAVIYKNYIYHMENYDNFKFTNHGLLL